MCLLIESFIPINTSGNITGVCLLGFGIGEPLVTQSQLRTFVEAGHLAQKVKEQGGRGWDVLYPNETWNLSKMKMARDTVGLSKSKESEVVSVRWGGGHGLTKGDTVQVDEAGI